MNFLLSAKGEDVTSWRAAEDFAAAYRLALLERAASGRCGEAETVFSATCATIDKSIATHQDLLKRLESLIAEVPSTAVIKLKELTGAFYGDLYRHFGHFRSAPAFYQLSMSFLRQASAAIIAEAKDQLERGAAHLPEMALIAVGPAGRCEYSPFCPLQILLVHGVATTAQLETINLLGNIIHAGFEDAGLVVDPVVTPRNPRWRGTLPEWQQRCEEGLHPLADDKAIDLCRLVDLYPLHPAEGFAGELKQTSSAVLSGSRPALANLVVRMTSLSNGIGLMGRLKLERSGSERGMFRLLDHGLLPLSAALSALALIKESSAVGNCDRIQDLLTRGKLDVELAERMLATWHTLHDLRLRLEQAFQIERRTARSLFLNPNELTDEQRESLKKTLESVAIIQHHVVITFSGAGE